MVTSVEKREIGIGPCRRQNLLRGNGMRLKEKSGERKGLGSSLFTDMFGAMKTRSAFTLVELLIVLSLLTAISLAVYGGVAAGVRIWKSIDASINEIDFIMGWKRFQKDMVNHLSFHGIEFYGTPDEFSFPGLVTVKDSEGLTHQEIGRIRYRFYESNRNLCRETITYPNLIQGLGSESWAGCQPVISSVKDVTIKYYGKEDGPASLGSWRSAWQMESAPIAVRLLITLEGTGEKSEIAKQRTATLP